MHDPCRLTSHLDERSANTRSQLVRNLPSAAIQRLHIVEMNRLTHPRFLAAEAALEKECVEKGHPDKYYGPSENETTNQTATRRRRIQQSLETDDEREQRLALKASGERDRYRIQQSLETDDERIQRLALKASGERERYRIRQSLETDDERKQRLALKASGERERYYEKYVKGKGKLLRPCQQCRLERKGLYFDHRYSFGTCSCLRPPAKKKIDVTGEGASPTIYSTGLVRHAKYLDKESEHLESVVVYKERNSRKEVHMFSIAFRHSRFSQIVQSCPVDDVLSAMIRFDGEPLWSMGESSRVSLGAAIEDAILVTHHFYDEDGPDLWEESFDVSVLCPLPENVSKEAVEMIDAYSDQTWNGHELYELLSKRGVSDVWFEEITWEEFSMRTGDDAYNVAREQVRDNKMTKVYGPNWREILNEYEKEEREYEKIIQLQELSREGWIVNGADKAKRMGLRLSFSKPCDELDAEMKVIKSKIAEMRDNMP
jgi:hypothetical protein